MSLFDRAHPSRYADDPARYPLTANDLDFVGVFEPEDDRGKTPIADRWENVLVYLESEIRALHRQLKADRDAALAKTSDEQPNWRPQTLLTGGKPSGQV